MPRSLLPTLVLCALLPTGGCCSFARFFCGPDKTPWVSVEFDAPESAVRTFLEALRRDDPDVLYLSLSDGYRQRLGIDLMAVNVAWERFREQNPGLHVAGYATVPTATRPSPGRAVVPLDIEGHRFEVQLVRQDAWLVRYERPQVAGREPFPPGTTSKRVESFAGFLSTEPTDDIDTTRLVIKPLPVRHEGVDELGVDAIEFAGLMRSWKVDDVRQLP